jgi:hypothetical protein
MLLNVSDLSGEVPQARIARQLVASIGFDRVARPPLLLLPFVLAWPPLARGEATPSVQVPRMESGVVVDGVLDEAPWEQAARLEGFHQYQPVDGRTAEERTEVRVFYTPTAICFGIIAHDRRPDAIRATVADRDNIDSDDNVTIHLDTFDDRRRSFFFAVNPLGVQQDGVRTEGSNSPGQAFGGETDTNPDFLFESKGRITDGGYVVEVLIPFKSLRYPGGGRAQRWGINVVRVTQRTGYVDTWTDVRRASASFLAQEGTLLGLHDLQRGVLVEAQPFVTAGMSGARAADGFRRDDVDPSAGLNLKLGLTSDLSIDATVNPDFSQVESDAGLVTVNERFALFFPEKRPFFLEGIELFATPNQLVYTRRVVDPVVGGKLSAKRGRFSLAHMTAVDQATGDDALFNVSRVRADYGGDSTGGLVLTDRDQGARRNTVLAGDTRWVFGKLYFVRAQLGGSRTADDGVLTSPLWHLEFDRTGRAWGFNYRVTGIGPDFQSDAGFVPRNDVVDAHAFNRVSFYGAPGSLLEQISFITGGQAIWPYRDFARSGPAENALEINADARLRGGWTLGAEASRSSFRYAPGAFRGVAVEGDPLARPYVPEDLEGALRLELGATTPAFKGFDAEAEVETGAVPIFAEGSEGRETSLTAAANLRAGGSLRVGGNMTLSRITRRRDGSEFARALIPRLKVEYQPRRSLFVRAVAEYQAQRRDTLRAARTGAPLLEPGRPPGRDDFNRLRVDLLLSFEPTPGTVAFLGYGSSLDNGRDFGFGALARDSDGFFLKLAYLFRK